MSIGSLRPRSQLILAASLPVLCLGIAAVLVWPRAARLSGVRKELDSTRGVIAQKRQVIEQSELAAGGRLLALAVARPTEDEPIEFLRDLAALTEASRAVLVSARSVAPTPTQVAPAPTSPQPASPGQSPTPPAIGGQRPVVPSPVTELADEVTVEGDFAQILTLLVRLENFERILSVSRCRITGSPQSYPRLRGTFTLSRFVAAPAVSAGAARP